MSELDLFFEKIWKRIADIGVDTGKIAYDFDKAKAEAKQALYSRLAAEAVVLYQPKDGKPFTFNNIEYVKVEAIPLPKLAEVFGIKE